MIGHETSTKTKTKHRNLNSEFHVGAVFEQMWCVRVWKIYVCMTTEWIVGIFLYFFSSIFPSISLMILIPCLIQSENHGPWTAWQSFPHTHIHTHKPPSPLEDDTCKILQSHMHALMNILSYTHTAC